MTDERKKLTPAEFRAQGYLLELNRQFLHPLGLALEIVTKEDGTEYFGGVWDSRDDPEGFIFGDFDDDDRQRAKRIETEALQKAEVRRARFGWVIEPLNHVAGANA